MERKTINDSDFEGIKRLFDKRPEPIKQTPEEVINDPDTLMNVVNREKLIRETQQRYSRNPNKNKEIARKSIGTTKKTKKSKISKALDITVTALLTSATVAALIAAGVFLERYMVKPVAERFKFEDDLKASLEIVTTDAKNNLEHLNLGYTDEDGNFELNDNNVSDYANLGLSDPTPAEIRAYMEVIDDKEEQSDFIKSVYYTENGLERTYTDFNQYCNINGFTDPTIGTPSSIVFNNITEAQLVDAYNNGTIYEVVHDLTNTHSKGGK